MTLKEYNYRLQELIDVSKSESEEVKEVRRKSALFLVNKMKDRIFNQGFDRNNEIIGEGYSTKPMYVEKKMFIKPSAFKAQGKNGNSVFGNGNNNKTMFIPDGYHGLKGVQGLVNDKVNILYSGKTKKSFSFKIDEKATYLGFTTIEEANKAEKVSKRYGGKIIFVSSEEEMLEYADELVKEHQRIVNKILNNA